MGSRSRLGRLEYGCQLDANDCSQWASGYSDFRSFEYHQCLHLGKYGGQHHHLHPCRHESLHPITASPGVTLTISGIGIANNSGITQNFMTATDPFGNGGTIVFSNSATAGSHVNILMFGGSTNFFNSSTAGSASIDNVVEGSTNFFDRSNAGSAHISNEGGGYTAFFNSSSAGSADIETSDGRVIFAHNSTAGSAYIGVTDNSLLQFFDSSSAGSAFIGIAGGVGFGDSSTAGSATISNAGFLDFGGSSRGGTGRLSFCPTGTSDISASST
jgi:hypothetical protein